MDRIQIVKNGNAVKVSDIDSKGNEDLLMTMTIERKPNDYHLLTVQRNAAGPALTRLLIAIEEFYTPIA